MKQTKKQPLLINPNDLKKITQAANNAIEGKSDYTIIGFGGYEKYSLRFNNDVAYLYWHENNDRTLIKNREFNWYGIFDAEPYLTHFPPYSEGYAFIQMQIAQKRFVKNFHKERNKRYTDFIESLKLGEHTPLMNLSSLDGLFNQLYRQLQKQIDEMERIDIDIQKVLKVYLYECEQQLKPIEDNKGDLFQMINDIKHLYQAGIRAVCKPDLLAENWFPKRMNRHYVPAPIAESTTAGTIFLCRKKEKVLLKAVPIFEKLLHLETLKYYALNDMPILTDDERDMPGTVSTDDIKAYDAEYWNTAFELHKVNTWEKVYEIMEAKRYEIGLDVKYSSFDSFSTSQKRESKKGTMFPKKGNKGT